jgi:PAS domain S-box-containing protein
LILADYSLPQFDGMTALRMARKLVPQIPFVIVTGSVSEEVAVECMKAGAADYVLKERLFRLGPAVKLVLERKQAWVEKQQAERDLRESEARFRKMADAAPVFIWMAGRDAKATYFNLPWLTFTGCTLEEEVGDGWTEVIHPEDRVQRTEKYLFSFAAQERFEMEYRIRRADGEYRWILDLGTPLFMQDGTFEGYIGSCVDITERKEAEEQLLASLKEKEVLLKEVHHRVKNNMQVIYSLFNLQANQSKVPEVRAVLKENQNRVRTLALVHEQLYRAKNLSRIDFGAYLNDLGTNLMRSLCSQGTVELRFDLQRIFLGVDIAIPCGLIVNEALSNALKHAFPEGRNGIVDLGLRANETGEICLSVKDNGVGLPAGFDHRRAETLGLKLVGTLTHQLKGILSVRGENGTEIAIKFNEQRRNL